MSSNDKSSSSTDRRIEALTKKIASLEEDLRRVDKERIEYLQNVSHQLVAPLNAIKWHIENLTNNRVGLDRAKKVLRSIYSQSTIAVHLAKNFALMSNIEADHTLSALREPLQQVKLLSLLINLADDFQPLGWDKDLTIEVVNNTALSSAPDVWAMKPLLSQAFSNIIENAVKYSHKHAEITIDGEYFEAADVVSVTIKNRGIPLPPTDTTRIFDRGVRTQEAMNLYPAGTGFGLFIAKRIIDIHEGVIGASTDETGRTVFEVVLPVRALEGKVRHRV
jgi:signal transduction histidine kinase